MNRRFWKEVFSTEAIFEWPLALVCLMFFLWFLRTLI